jgi:hypothetical protein
MDINYVTILGAGVTSLVVGSIWYGPLFGKKWMEVCGVNEMDEAKRKQMQKEALPLYGIQFALTLLQLYVLVDLVNSENGSAVGIAFWMWLGFVMPTIAGSAMWNNNPNNVKGAMFLIQAGYQLVMFLIYGYMLGLWA